MFSVDGRYPKENHLGCIKTLVTDKMFYISTGEPVCFHQ